MSENLENALFCLEMSNRGDVCYRLEVKIGSHNDLRQNELLLDCDKEGCSLEYWLVERIETVESNYFEGCFCYVAVLTLKNN